MLLLSHSAAKPQLDESPSLGDLCKSRERMHAHVRDNPNFVALYLFPCQPPHFSIRFFGLSIRAFCACKIRKIDVFVRVRFVEVVSVEEFWWYQLSRFERSVVRGNLSYQFDIEPRLQRNTVAVRMRESALGGQPADQRMQIDVAADIERSLKDQPVGRTVTLSLRLDARRFGPDAELTPSSVEFTTSVRSQRVVERIPTVPVLLAMSFTTLEVPLQAVGRDGTPLTLVTQTITVTGTADEVKRLARGETRAYGVIQIKEADLAQTGVFKLATPEFHLPKGVELVEAPPPIEFQLISRKDSTQNP